MHCRHFEYKASAKTTSFRVTPNDISLIMKILDSRKSHDFDNISIKMIQICGKSIALPLKF